MVKLEQVYKKLGKFLLQDINIEIPAGYICGLIGANGSGKTSLLHIIMGLYLPDRGKVSVMGKSFAQEETAIRNAMGVVLQERLFEETMTLKQNVDFYGKFYEKYDGACFLQLLEKFELDADRKYAKLSKGEELKFQFAFALSHYPKLLILDEPTGNFDPDFREDFWKCLKEFIADGEHSVILATHLTDDLDRMADYIIWLDNGEVFLSQNIEQMRDDYRLLCGEEYKLKLLPKEYVIHMEKGEFGSRALIRHKKRFEYDESLTVMRPTIEELMYFVTKGTQKEKT